MILGSGHTKHIDNMYILLDGKKLTDFTVGTIPSSNTITGVFINCIIAGSSMLAWTRVTLINI